MGVKDMWNLLSPVTQKISLYELQGKTVAIDLSCWVCEGQIIGERTIQPRLYLRNVYFRTETLIFLNIKPIFVLDGDAPDLKLKTMRERNNARFNHNMEECSSANGADAKKSSKVKRSRFRSVLNTCRQMLELMGVTCLQSDGEAEALCGQLFKDGVVDGVITQDSDVFLYGARVVFRNLTIKAGAGSVECFDMEDIEKKLNLTREKLVAMSLLCGCDYDQGGVHGVGKETAYKYLSTFNGDILQRLKNLKTDKILKRYEEERENCSKCSHQGKLSDHRKSGCFLCGLEKGCLENTSPLAFKNLDDEEKKIATIELAIRSKTSEDILFPNNETINEFLHYKQKYNDVSTPWLKPQLSKLCIYCNRMLEWELDYAFEKNLPLFTRWLLKHSPSLKLSELVPVMLIKKRVIKGVPSFNVSWNVADENISSFLSLLTDDCSTLLNGQCITSEPLQLIEKCMPELYHDFLERTKKKPKEKKMRKKKESKTQKLCNSKSSENLAKGSEVVDLDLSTTFFKNLQLEETTFPFSNSIIQLTSTPSLTRKEVSFQLGALEIENKIIDANITTFSASSHSMDLSKASGSILSDDTTVDYDVSEIIDGIISRRCFYQ